MTREEKIEAYILGRLETVDLKAFEEEIKNDESLQQEVEAMRSLIMGIETFELKNKLQSIASQYTSKEEDKKGKVISFNRLKYLAIAASIIAVASVGVWFLPDKVGDELLLSDYFYKDPGLPTRMGASDQYNFYEGMVSYKTGDYSNALELWDAVEGGIGMDTLTFYRSMAYLNMKNWQRFMDEINQLPGSSPFAEKANWYKLQVHLEQEDFDAARELLPRIADDKAAAVKTISEFLDGKR